MGLFARVPDDYEWIIYARISDDREGAGLGVKRQTEDGFDLAGKLGGQVLTVCCDNDMTANDRSGRYKPRPEYDQMCELLRARPGRRGVISWHTDRLHRTPRELEDFIDLVELSGAEVQTVKAGHIDLSTASGRMTARVHCAVARHESEHKSERIRRKTLELAEAGTIYGGGPRPFGYTRIYSGEGPRRKIVRDDINPEEATTVRECARRLLAGGTLRSVVRWLNDSGVRSSTGRRWSQQALRYMMRSGRIAGLREHRRQVIGEAVWDGIITVEQHQQLRTMLDHNQRSPGASRVRIHYLSGYVFCSDCARERIKMRVGRQHGKLKYKCPPLDGCNGRVVPLADLENLIGVAMADTLSDPEALRQLAARESDNTDQTTVLVDKVQADERRLARLQSELTEGDEEDIPEVAASLRVLRRRIRENQAELSRIAGLPAALRESLPDMAKRWPTLDLDLKRTLLDLFIRRIIIHPARRGYPKFDPSRVQIEWVSATD